MKRSELYKKVWTAPIVRLARELGISDVGLAKACRRHAIPVPPRGYWAKLNAGKNPAMIPLPAPELDVPVHFATSEPDEQARRRTMAQDRSNLLEARAAEATRLPPVEFAKTLDAAHPLVRATQKYCERIPKLIERSQRRGYSWTAAKPEDHPPPEQHGRYNLSRKGCLTIVASLEAMDWILLFHATLLGGLLSGGMKVAQQDEQSDRVPGRTDAPAIELRFDDEVLTLRFSEGYRRVRLTPPELEEKRKKEAWAREFEMRPSGNFTLSIEGGEYQARKSWQGSKEKFEGQINEIIQTAFHLAAWLPKLRSERTDREARARKEEELRAQERRRREARDDQLKQAFTMMEADARVQQLYAFLDRLEKNCREFSPPYDERARVWIDVIKSELSARNPVDEMLQKCLSVPTWASWPPAWWPDNLQSS
jgi:hypothetical protein